VSELARPVVEAPRWRDVLAGMRRPHRFVAQLVRRVQEEHLVTIAAAMSYYFFFALFPFLLFLLSVVTVLPIRGLDDWVLSQASQFVPGEAYGMLEGVVRGILRQPRSGLLSLGAALALWSSSAAFASVMDGLNRAYRVSETRPWWRLRLHAMGLTLALSGFMILAFVLAVFAAPFSAWVGRVLGPAGGIASLVLQWVVVIAVVTLVAATIYYACPDVEQQHYHWVTPGSVLFTLGFGGTSMAFSYYVGRFGSYDRTYGSLGAVIVLLFWMYLLAFFLLLGGLVNALLEHMSPAGKQPGERRRQDVVPELDA
jgi:membrane protein